MPQNPFSVHPMCWIENRLDLASGTIICIMKQKFVNFLSCIKINEREESSKCENNVL